MNQQSVSVLMSALLLAAAGTLAAQSGSSFESVTYQGELRRAGIAWTGIARMKFVVVDGSLTVWSHDNTSGNGLQPTGFLNVPVANGIFSVALGDASMHALPAGGLLPGASNPQLRVWVDTGSGFEQLSDQPLAGVFRSQTTRQIGAMTGGTIPRWNGSALSQSNVFEDASGAVGIGTSAPLRRLDVRGFGPSSGILMNGDFEMTSFDPRVLNSGGGNLRLLGGANGSTPITLNENGSGNVGIGTTTPGYRLSVVSRSDDAIRQLMLIGDLSANGQSGTDLAITGSANGISITNRWNDLYLGTSGAGQIDQKTVTIKAGGNVGIGTTAPTATLHVIGNLTVSGTISSGALIKPGGSFRIDHPLDPDNKYLSHSFVESPDMMNVYNGNVTMDDSGEAVVTLPDWFEALNGDYRYQLTPIGAPAPDLHVAQEVADCRFRIAGGKKGQRVSWQVTGIRRDAYALANRVEVETPKPESERGKKGDEVRKGGR